MEGKTEFVIFCIENLAARIGMDAEAVYRLLAEKTDILAGYIIPSYEVLHSQSKDYIMEELLEVMREKGAVA